MFESLAYIVGFRVYAWQRRAGDFLPDQGRMWVVTAAIAGAAIGSKLLNLLEDPVATIGHWNDLAFLAGGKTIVGALIGGTMAVEWTKRKLGITRRTGDLFAIPLCLGIAIGRIGCFLTGLPDQTFGLPTRLPWGVDFGDGIPRHPAQLYESLFMLSLAGWIYWRGRQPHREGDLYRTFLVFYMAFRLLVNAVKPGARYGGLTGLQWAALGCVLWYWRDLPWILAPGRVTRDGRPRPAISLLRHRHLHLLHLLPPGGWKDRL